jgi:hypothetical protein
MTIKWGDSIECNGVRPDWLRDDEQRIAFQDHHGDWYGDATNVPWFARELDIEQPQHIRLPADHPAYVALASGFTPWSGGESAPDDADLMNGALLRNGTELHGNVSTLRYDHEGNGGDVIGYRKRAAHTDGTRPGGQPPPLATFVPVKRMTEAEARHGSTISRIANRHRTSCTRWGNSGWSSRAPNASRAKRATK